MSNDNNIKEENNNDALQDYYTPLKSQITKYLRFGIRGDKTVLDITKDFYSVQIPDDLKVMQVPSIESKLAKLHAIASFELSMAQCALALANEMYDTAYSNEMDVIRAQFLGQREPGMDKLKVLVVKSLDPRFIYQKLYANNAVTIMIKVLEHLDFIGWRLKNTVAACSVDIRLEKGQL